MVVEKMMGCWKCCTENQTTTVACQRQPDPLIWQLFDPSVHHGAIRNVGKDCVMILS